VSTNIGYLSAMMTTSKSIDRGYRFPAEVIEQAVWHSIRFPPSLRMVEDLLAARGIVVSHESGTTPCGFGLRRSAGPAPARSVGAPRSSATSGISMRSWYRSTARRSAMFAPSMRMASFGLRS
jgi:hypothetical protein